MGLYSVEWLDANSVVLRVSSFTATDLQDALRLVPVYLGRIEEAEQMGAVQCVVHFEGEL